MPSQRIDQEITVLDAKSATGVDKTTGIDISPYRHVMLSFATDGGGTADLTAQVQGAISDDAPTWTSAQSASNMWDYISMYDYEDAGIVDGDTGFSVSGGDDYRIFLVNIDGLKWLNVNVTAYTAGSVTVKLRAFNNL